MYHKYKKNKSNKKFYTSNEYNHRKMMKKYINNIQSKLLDYYKLNNNINIIYEKQYEFTHQLK